MHVLRRPFETAGQSSHSKTSRIDAGDVASTTANEQARRVRLQVLVDAAAEAPAMRQTVWAEGGIRD